MGKAAAIACATNEAYAEMAGVMLRSLAMNGGIEGVSVYLVGDGLATDTVAALCNKPRLSVHRPGYGPRAHRP